jgi:hypothetical protein
MSGGAEAMTGGDSYFAAMASLARRGFAIVPAAMDHAGKGPGTLYMSGDGIRFEPFDGADPIVLTWEEFDEGPGMRG